MAKIYFNMPIIKHLEEITILNFFVEDSGRGIFIRDARKDVYRDQKFVYGDINFYTKDGNYYIDILPMNKLASGDIFGVYVGEGYDFEVVAKKEPIFIVRQDSTKFTLGMTPGLEQGIDVKEVALGMFHVGTTISFKRDGQNIKDELTKNGWVRRSGPSDKDFGIITVEEAFAKKLKNDEKAEQELDAKVKERIERIEFAKKNKQINPILADELIASELDDNPEHVYMFLAEDIKKLKKQKIL